jgi:hypothetical protein
MKVSALRTLTAELDCLLHLFHRLRPILCVGCLYRKVPERLDAIEKALALFERPETLHVLLCFGIVAFVQCARQMV